MTEAEWLAGDDPEPMLNFLNGQASDRKRRLLVCACFRQIPDAETGANDAKKLMNTAVNLAERSEDDPTLLEQMLKIRGNLRYLQTQTGFSSESAMLSYIAEAMLSPTFATNRVTWALVNCRRVLATYARRSDNQPNEAGRVKIAEPLRDIFGNPFRPVVFSPEWKTNTAVALARQMYDSRDFGAMPILADAIQDAGCDNDDILSHSRDANAQHVRGCWVVDLVLGKR